MYKNFMNCKLASHIYIKQSNVVCCAQARPLCTLSKLESSLQGRTGLTLRLFSDACSSQNKNSVMLCLLARFVERSKVFHRVVHTFPVRGHSYMPPNRVFGRIEKI